MSRRITMKTLRILCSLCICLIVVENPGVSQTHAPGPLVQSLDAATTLMRELKGALARHMARGGPSAAIAVCADSAQILTRSLEASVGLSIQRVSTRWRNPLNAPDSLDTLALSRFEKMAAARTLTDTSTMSFRTSSDSVILHHTYVPIITQPFCLTCHGARDALGRGVDSLLAVRYPDDRATGYAAGDLRGAIRIRMRIK